MDSELWTLTELTDRAGEALRASGYAGSGSARTNDLPDLRTLRYYTTLSLLDRPAEMRGRTAYYHRRHLLQAVAIKQLQSVGKSLQEIQKSLINRPDAELEQLAKIPKTFWQTSATETERRARFWADQPQQTAAPLEFETSALTEITVAPGVRLLLDQDLTPEMRLRMAPALTALRSAIHQQ